MATFPTLNIGDTIGIMAPSNRTDRTKVDDAVKVLQSMGYKVKVHPQTHMQFYSSAGTAKDKVDAFHELWADPDVKAIMGARGGNQSGEMLTDINYKKIAAQPKILIGFSDVTSLLLAVNKHADIITFHGPLLNSILTMDQGQLTQCFRLLSGHQKIIDLSGSQEIRGGQVQGRLIGGNLSVLCSLMGTPYQPDFDGALLFLEDIGDELSRINRFFLQLKLAGVFNKISGLIVGDFSHMTDTGRVLFERPVKDIIAHHTHGTPFPIVTDAPFGHNDELITLPVGAQATLTTSQNSKLTLS
ncbi:MAG: LD-carboxypeptidase [Micavibrio aeruginosavorus]|uniref:LD-carboxypeptidase n=1 Tax=Micavibrio aeruginosavorus TaxID=349221 RepID=A0A7T5R174_9BACT|nr:MAG: LD-carboxypeptidase [Micavibrio aeruginosavorus]